MAVSGERAEAVALQGLAWLAGDNDLVGKFLDMSGAEVADLRAAAGNPGLLGAVLDFILADDRRVLDFCADTGLPPELPLLARQSLPGGEAVHWT